MSAEAEPSSRGPWKATDGDRAGEEDGVDSQDLGGGQEEQGDLQHRDYDVETVERVYRCVTDKTKKNKKKREWGYLSNPNDGDMRN